MFGSETIVIFAVAAAVALAVGGAAVWSNPRRTINRAFFLASIHVATWLYLLQMAVTSGDGLFWLRVTTAVGAFFPLQLWLIMDGIVCADEPLIKILSRRGWLLLGLTALAIIPLTEWFIPGHTTQKATANQVYGTGYHLYYVGLVIAYAFVGKEGFRQMRMQDGLSRLELQIVLIGGCTAAVAVLLLMGLRATLGIPWLIQLQPFVVLMFYAGIVIAITRSRIFNARQILLLVTQKFLLISIVMGAAFFLDGLFGTVLPEPFAFFSTTAIALWFAGLLTRWLDRLFHFYPQAEGARQAAFSVARRETRGETLERDFLAILKGWGQSDHALLISGTKDGLRGNGVELPGECAIVIAMRQLRWATPERLARERSTPERVEVARFLAGHGLGVLVIGEGPTLTALVGVGVAASRLPFTYPQVAQLMELASIIESAIERAYFSVKVQHAEQLATVGLLGASLAHEIRNPLVSIKTFVQLLPTHHQDPAFREKFFRLIGHEVDRIDRLTVQLLDLASPRAYVAEVIELHPVLRASLDLVAAKATDKNIQFLTDFRAEPDQAFTDASAAKQVMLNLCFNAIQALDAREGNRWIKISTRNVASGIEMAVADSGPGIAPEIRARLFQPFQSTKSSGFGLGLAICSDILANLNATITVDPHIPGSGATFRVIFPCQPSSS